jgi:hypothetical protein
MGDQDLDHQERENIKVNWRFGRSRGFRRRCGRFNDDLGSSGLRTQLTNSRVNIRTSNEWVLCFIFSILIMILR